MVWRFPMAIRFGFSGFPLLKAFLAHVAQKLLQRHRAEPHCEALDVR